jgi:hypothetical protein
MINLKNYAILAEQKKYGYFNRINESNGQTAENLKLVLSGENNDTYIKQWNQFMGDVEKNIQKDGTYTVKIKDNAGAEMVSINYTIINNELPEDTIVLTPGVQDKQNGQLPLTIGDPKTYTDEELQKDVDKLVDLLDGSTYTSDLIEILDILKKYVGHFGLGDDDKTKVPAIGRILTLYKVDESGDTLIEDMNDVGTSYTDNAERLAHDNIGRKRKKDILDILKNYKEEY